MIQQPQQQNNGYNPSPFTHAGIMGAGLGVGYYGFNKANTIKNGVENYGTQKKYFNKVDNELSRYNNLESKNKGSGVIGDNLNNYMKSNNIEDVNKVKGHLLNNDAYRGITKVKGYRALGLLGLGTTLYGGYKMVSQDMSRHPVLNGV